MAVSEHDKKYLSAEDQAKIQKATDYGAATGDWAGAHEMAEEVRSKAGYSGGDDGSGYSAKTTTSSGTTTSNKTYTKPSNFTGSATGVNTYTDDQSSIVAQMNANSQKWFDAPSGDENTVGTKEWLHKQNQILASQLGGNVGSSFDSASGTWGGSAAKPIQPEWSNTLTPQIESLLNKILNREDFSYDYTTDPSYLAYADQYKRLGDRAREDTLGDIAGLTGGLPSSWAVSAASQAQNDYNQQLSGVIPTLYDAAYNRYLNEDSLMRDDLGLLLGIDQTNYDRYRDTVSDSQWQQSFDTSNSQWQQSFDWNKTVDQWNMSNTESTQKFDQLLTKWQMTGVADEEVAAALGVPVGATTESYYFNKAQLSLDQAKLAQSQRESSKVNENANQLEASIARNAANLINNTESYANGANYILSAVSSADEYYRIGSSAGIPTSILDEVFDSFYDQALKEPDGDDTGENSYTYYAALMGQQEDQAAWLEANKWYIPADIFEKLTKLLDY